MFTLMADSFVAVACLSPVGSGNTRSHFGGLYRPDYPPVSRRLSALGGDLPVEVGRAAILARASCGGVAASKFGSWLDAGHGFDQCLCFQCRYYRHHVAHCRQLGFVGSRATHRFTGDRPSIWDQLPAWSRLFGFNWWLGNVARLTAELAARRISEKFARLR